MSITRKCLSPLMSLLLATLPLIPHAYEVETHAKITRGAIARSTLSDTATLRRLGLYPELQATWVLRPDNGVYQDSWASGAGAKADLMIEVAVRKEDSGLRALQHFFDPQNDRGQTVRMSLSGSSRVIGLRSWQWALSEMDEWTDVPYSSVVTAINPDENQFTSGLAKDFLEQAIIAPGDEARRRSHGRFLAAIGHVVHHIQDMAQPDHVRNDSHCNARTYCVPAELAAQEDVYDPSEFEPFVRAFGYAGFNLEDYPIPQFDSYEAFWANAEHSGIADFTSRFAVSKDTNFRGDLQSIATHPEFLYPNGASASTTEELTSIELMDGVVASYTQTAVRSSYIDSYFGSFPANDHLTATHSLFALDLEAAKLLGYDVGAVMDAGFTIGRNTYLSAASHLLPRAEAYSAGLINYLLRGRIGAKVPASGYYAIADFSPTNAFAMLKFELRNETPDVQPLNRTAIPQPAGAGTLTAVVSYRPNPCYEDDLSGELHFDEPDYIPSDCTVSTWLAALDEVRSVSAPLAVSGIDREWAEFEFDFSANPIPFSARDVEVYFVFRGTLGSEEDAIIVDRKNISEPTYYTTWNSSDWVWTSSGWQDGYSLLTNTDNSDDKVAAQYHDMSYDYDLSDPYLAGPDRLNPGNYHQLVALVDRDAGYMLRSLRTPELYLWPIVRNFSWNPLVNETREVKERTIVYWFGMELPGPLRYRNKWCDDQGCTVSGLERWRGFSKWSMLREYYYIDGGSISEPTAADWDILNSKTGIGQQPVTLHE